jgi:hypothetical protein
MTVQTNNVRASVPAMKGDMVFVDEETSEAIMKVVNAEPAKTKSAAMCSQMAAVNLNRIRGEEADGGCAPIGPPFTQQTGMGWDTSVEPKNREDMTALTMALNPAVGFWGDSCHRLTCLW